MQTREEKLEKALVQLMELTADFLNKEAYWKIHYGSDNRLRMDVARAKIEKAFLKMGVDKETNFYQLKIEFKEGE